MPKVKHWIGSITSEQIKDLDWQIRAFVSEAEEKELVVFEIPKGNEHLIKKIETLIQDNVLKSQYRRV